jgi:outer membrane translocation and assembly module TamA
MELEANLNEEGTDVYGEYTPLTAREILVKDIDELRLAVREMKEAAAAEQQAEAVEARQAREALLAAAAPDAEGSTAMAAAQAAQ